MSAKPIMARIVQQPKPKWYHFNLGRWIRLTAWVLCFWWLIACFGMMEGSQTEPMARLMAANLMTFRVVLGLGLAWCVEKCTAIK